MDSSELVNNGVYSMSLYAPQLYGSTLDDVTFLGRVNSTLVSAYNVIPEEEHRKAFIHLPSGTVDDSASYSWLLFRTPTGIIRVIGEPWIQEGSLVSEGAIVVYKVSGIVGDANTPAKIRNALSSVGIYEFEITTN